MKYKSKFVLCGIIFIIIALGIVYSVNAANNLRALHDKYKASYNNFMKALKEGANQEEMNLLSAQCKADYAEYQKELKSSSTTTSSDSQIKTITGNPVLEEKEDKNQSRVIESSISKKTTDTCETLLVVQKNVTIMINGKNRTVKIPYFNPEFIKKHTPIIQTENTGNTILTRIGEKKKNSKYYEVPVSYKQLGYPLNSNDEIRCEGEKKVYELYQLVTKVDSSTYSDLIQSIYTLAYKIMDKYGKYPDICAAAQLYINDAMIKYSKSAGYFGYFTSTSLQYFGYSQLASQYSHLKDSNKTIEAIINICKDRKSEIQINNKRLVDDNIQRMKYIDQNKKELDKLMSPSYVHYGKPDEQVLKNHAEDIKRLCNSICQQYIVVYQNYMQMNDKDSADRILKINKIGGKYVISGDLYKAYCIAYEKKLKYEYTVCLPNRDCPNYQTITGEETVKLFRDADCLLGIVNYIKSVQTFDKIDEIEPDGRSRNERRTLDMCDYINDFKPSSGSAEKNEAKEEITDEQLARRKKYAYALNETEGYEFFDFYKRKPFIKEMYITRNADVRLLTYEIFLPREYLTLRLKLDVSDYQNQYAPDYAFRCKVYTVKQTIDKSDDPSSTPPATALKGKAKPEIDRYKYVTILPDNLNNGYYGKFQANETDNFTDKTKNLIDITPPYQTDSLNIKSIATYHGEKKFDYPSALWGSSYFNVKLMKAVVKDLYDSNDRENVISSPSFLRAGGAEYIVAEKDNNMKCQALIKHTADYFIVTGHGSESKGMVGEVENHIIKNGISPEELITVENNAVTYSEYDNTRFLILAVCNCLNHYSNSQYNNAEKWYKVLPNGVILGYHGETWNIYNDKALKTMADHLSDVSYQNFDPYTIGYLWAWANKKVYYASTNYRRSNDQYAFIVNGAYFHGEWKTKPGSNKFSLETSIKPISQ
ncbi:MAG: hypothetical protein PHR57_02855 [Patescibacteria group bacterium]|nr:hypothetical protein [Patescibacteria group bacterium]